MTFKFQQPSLPTVGQRSRNGSPEPVKPSNFPIRSTIEPVPFTVWSNIGKMFQRTRKASRTFGNLVVQTPDQQSVRCIISVPENLAAFGEIGNLIAAMPGHMTVIKEKIR